VTRPGCKKETRAAIGAFRPLAWSRAKQTEAACQPADNRDAVRSNQPNCMIGTAATRRRFTGEVKQRKGRRMTRLLSGVAAIAFIASGAVLAQTYPPAPPPALAPPPVTAPPVSPSSTTTTIAPNADGGFRASTTQHGVDINGNPVTQKDIYKEGIAGSSETHSTTTTDPSSGATTTRSTTINPQ
jgi:hypothetical protein